MKKHITLITMLLCVSMTALAVPAKRGGIVKTMADGTEKVLYLHGDETFHYYTDAEGNRYTGGTDGRFVQAGPMTPATAKAMRNAAPRRMVRNSDTESPLNLAPRGLLILVSFSDVSFSTSEAEIDSMLNGSNYSREYTYRYQRKNYTVKAEGSAKQYFKEQSGGQYVPHFDIVGPVTVSREQSYYGQNDEYYNQDMYAEELLVEACQIADEKFGVDFTQYDCNDDGQIDFVYMLYAGYGEADGGEDYTIWPHSYSLQENYYLSKRKYGKGKAKVYLDGKLLNRYACSNELNSGSTQYNGIGTICHEFSHVLGLPDLYDTGTYDASGNTTYHHQKLLGNWDILDAGPYNNDGNTPPAYSAYERFFMGWLTPEIISEQTGGHYTLEDLKTSHKAYLLTPSGQHNLIGNDPDPAYFLLLENRQQTGWDTYLPWHGMLLTKIAYNADNWANNMVNNYADNLGVDLLEADNLAPAEEYDEYYQDWYPQDGTYGKPGDAFPTGATNYRMSFFSMYNIEENDAVISFDINVRTALDDLLDAGEQVLDIYDLLGNRQPVHAAGSLPRGVYIVRTNRTVKKIYIQ